jgi:hypothetical protein
MVLPLDPVNLAVEEADEHCLIGLAPLMEGERAERYESSGAGLGST